MDFHMAETSSSAPAPSNKWGLCPIPIRIKPVSVLVPIPVPVVGNLHGYPLWQIFLSSLRQSPPYKQHIVIF